MAIKSKKWYQNQIKCLETATDKLHNESRRLGDIYFNDIAGFNEANKYLKQDFDRYNNQLRELKHEYYLYYRN